MITSSDAILPTFPTTTTEGPFGSTEEILKGNENKLQTDDLQFGFKKGLGCADAIFTLGNVAEYFTRNGSTVYAASLDISKAFDKVSHYRMFIRLIKAGLTKCIIDVLVNWYSKLTSAVKWNTYISRWFVVGSGV